MPSMDAHPILICGKEADSVHAVIESHFNGSVGSVLIREADLLLDILPRPDFSMVIASSDIIDDPIFRSWRRNRLADLPLVLIQETARRRRSGNGFSRVTTLPKSDLSALPYIIEFARSLTNRTGKQTGGAAAHAEKAEVQRKQRIFVGRSTALKKVIENTRKVLNVGSSVLIQGESGTGKELVASMVHYESDRLNKPFIKVNCAAIPETLLESELFGIEEKTATNVDGRIGKFEQAEGGTIFLDEIGDMSLLTQSKVLRVLQEREFERVGGSESIHVNVRVIAATNKDLLTEIRERQFRSDLYYRLNVISIFIPPLRERAEDILPLTEHFIALYSRRNNLTLKQVSGDVIDLLMQYHWPGNIRELENTIERALVIGEGDVIQRKDLPPHILGALAVGEETPMNPDSLRRKMREFERNTVVGALERSGWIQARAAEKLGISERSMWHLFKKYSLHEIRKRV